MNWTAPFLEPEPEALRGSPAPASHLRRTFDVPGPVASAVLRATACGIYQVYVNGQRVGRRVFAPGFTQYDRRLQVQEYNVTPLLRPGINAVGAVLGDGWFRGKLGVFSKRNVYGDKTKLSLSLEFTDGEGGVHVVQTDEHWRVTQDGPIRLSDWKDGEVYDATREMEGWATAGFDDRSWARGRISSWGGVPIPDEGEELCEQETFKPAVLNTPDGSTVLDFGQNLFGYVSFTLRCEAGRTIVLTHGEVLDEHGNFTLKNLQPEGNFGLSEPPRQRITYIARSGEQRYTPSFTAHGFRYAKLENWPEPVVADDFTAIAVYSSMTKTGQFSCSNPLVNRFVHNVQWSQRSNFVDVPTDCPTRERAPWTGDIGVFARTASYLMDTRRFLTRWLRDLVLVQNADGSVPNFAPSIGWPTTLLDGSAGWGDAIVIVPDTLYEMYGDPEVLAIAWDAMVRWVEFLRRRAAKSSPWSLGRQSPHVIDTGYHWGEWLEPGHSMATDFLWNLVWPDAEVATAYYAHALRRVARAGRVLGHDGEAARYESLAGDVMAAYRARFTRDGIVESERQCRYVRPIALDLLPESDKTANAAILNRKVIDNGYRIGTGFLTTPFILGVLSDCGYADTAWRMLENTSRPGWLYPVTRGATTIWENWNGIDDDRVPRDSMNHYAFGAAAGWLFDSVAGVRSVEPGFRRLRVAPLPGGSVRSVRCSYASASGPIRSDWEVTEHGEFVLDIAVPVPAEVRLPDGTHTDVGPGTHHFTCRLPAAPSRQEAST